MEIEDVFVPKLIRAIESAGFCPCLPCVSEWIETEEGLIPFLEAINYDPVHSLRNKVQGFLRGK
jgi:hypothetical protein